MKPRKSKNHSLADLVNQTKADIMRIYPKSYSVDLEHNIIAHVKCYVPGADGVAQSSFGKYFVKFNCKRWWMSETGLKSKKIEIQTTTKGELTPLQAVTAAMNMMKNNGAFIDVHGTKTALENLVKLCYKTDTQQSLF